MAKYSGLGLLGFTVQFNDIGEVTPAMLRAALMRRVADLDADPSQWLEACTPLDDVVDDEGQPVAFDRDAGEAPDASPAIDAKGEAPGPA